MSTPVSDAVQEAQVAGKLIRGVGPIVTLSVAVLVLCSALTFSVVTAKVGADRWTKTDHHSYVRQHDKEKNTEDKQLAKVIASTHEDIAVLKATVSRMEDDLQVIKSAVIKIERNGIH